MQKADILLGVYRERGSKGLPLERVYRHLFDQELYLRAYGKIYRNFGAMTPGSTEETVDSMSLQKIDTIIGLLRMERYKWEPVRRTYIEKANGKMRPLGIPTWSDKLLQEVMRMLMEAFYEQKFSDRSHGFRPDKGCHTALQEIQNTWHGVTWFIEGDIKGCFDNIDHTVLLEIIRRSIHDGRLLNLLDGLLKAGYMEDWRYNETLSGTPQGGIISPLLANIYLDELDRYVGDTLIPAYTRGDRRKSNPDYDHLSNQLKRARRNGETEEIRRLKRERRKLMSVDPHDQDYRRLRYIRYADDFLLGFNGPKTEAEEIRQRLGDFLKQQLRLTLSEEKTLITHSGDEKAKFLGYEIKVYRKDYLTSCGGRYANGAICLLMPQKVVSKYKAKYSRKGKVTHRNELLHDMVYTIVQRYQNVLQGLYNFYCMAVNVGNETRMGYIKWVLETSLTKTLAHKLKIGVPQVYKKYQVTVLNRKMLRVIVTRPGKKALIAVFGGFPLERKPEGMGVVDSDPDKAWFSPGGKRSEVVQRLFAGECELCGTRADVYKLNVHHIRKLSDIDKPGRRPKALWEKIMAARKRKTLVVCKSCHEDIHAGRINKPLKKK